LVLDEVFSHIAPLVLLVLGCWFAINISLLTELSAGGGLKGLRGKETESPIGINLRFWDGEIPTLRGKRNIRQPESQKAGKPDTAKNTTSGCPFLWLSGCRSCPIDAYGVRGHMLL